jgi:hypothetical protein
VVVGPVTGVGQHDPGVLLDAGCFKLAVTIGFELLEVAAVGCDLSARSGSP